MPNGKGARGRAEVWLFLRTGKTLIVARTRLVRAGGVAKRRPCVDCFRWHETPWTSGRGHDAWPFRGMLDKAATATQAPLCAAATTHGARRLQSLSDAASPRRTAASRGRGRQDAACLVTECIVDTGHWAAGNGQLVVGGHSGPSPGPAVGIRQAAVRAQRRLDAARRRGYDRLGC